MSGHIHPKSFLDYPSQINLLKQKQLTIHNETIATNILKKISYYSLINGYKEIFKDSSTNNYYPGTSFDDIHQLYLFDAKLREIFLKYILIFEKHIKSSISYHFSNTYGNGIAAYQDFNNYDYGKNLADVQHLFKKMNSKIYGRHPSLQVTHHITIYNDVPLWVLTTDLTLGETACMYRYLKGHCKTLVCNDFQHIGRAELGKMLIILTKFRNICAHGNRLFNVKVQDSIPDLLAHKKLHIARKNFRYQHGKSDLFATVISLKYLLEPADFRLFYYELKRTIKKYSLPDKVLSAMGFPPNWMSILRIKVY
ncbi:MAG: Abi family protein [Lachnospiraceae bacterium]|nr:Abi family protein [Lachnospiraceae bacterium]